MAGLSELLLTTLEKSEEFDSVLLATELCIEHEKIVGAVKSLQAKGNLIECTEAKCKRWLLTDEGNQIADNGSHEAAVFNSIPSEGIALEELMAKIANAKIGFGKAKARGWVELVKCENGAQKVARKVEEIDDLVQRICQQIRSLDFTGVTDDQKKECKKRNLIKEEEITYYNVRKGVNFTTNLEKPETDLTADMISSGSWRQKQFKVLNFDSCGKMPDGGHLHPLLKVRTQFRQIFLEMGFTEMPTNNFVESSFWNFDALFQPQQHPARDAHDTFFVSDPAEAQTHKFPVEYLEKVKAVHSVGGYGSQGYKYDWKLSEAAKNIMRTHTTGVSARMLYQLAQQETFRPAKYFSIDRVFRNEALDATHLAEFHQIEGLVADYGLTLGNMMGIIEQFFSKCGIKKIRFKPAYNPYTEPSMEIFSYHEGMKKWVEVGNSGVFRPEMLLPMGLPPAVSVIAWGLSLERPTMIKYGIHNIRDLFGPKINLHKVYTNPLCRLEK